MYDRVRTSLFISPLLILAFISEIFLFLFLLSICILITYETNLNAKKYTRIYTYLLIIFIYFLLLSLNYNVLIYAVYISLLSFTVSIFFNILGLRKNKENLNFTNQISLDGKDVINLFFLRETSTIYYLSGVLSIFFIYQSPSEINWVLLPLLTVFAIDSFSYIIGSRFGQRKLKLLEIISPNKTLIGYITAFLTGFIVFYILNYFFFNIFSPSTSLVISIAFPICAVFGDLYSSGIKRNFGLKDYGNILPGHGGVLDRLDSVIITMVLMSLAKVFIS